MILCKSKAPRSAGVVPEGYHTRELPAMPWVGFSLLRREICVMCSASTGMKERKMREINHTVLGIQP